jgi:ubiquitin-conjugating enzyme E2 O
VCWFGSKETELVSVLELDPHGSSADGYVTQGGPENFGVRRGDFVLIHPEGSTNGSQLPRVPRLGELEDWVREVPSGNDIKTAGWRGEMAEIGMKVAAERDQGTLVEGKVSKYRAIRWFGEVTDVSLLGFVPDVSF